MFGKALTTVTAVMMLSSTSASAETVSLAETQAIAARHSTMDELVMLTTHGLLHLLGFDHAEPEDEREMFGLQKELITSFQSAERKRRA